MPTTLPPPATSTIRGLLWPGIPSARGRTIVSLLYQFERSEWWPADEIQANQFRQLGRLLAHACGTVPYYRERLKTWKIADPGKITPEEWMTLPTLRRQAIQAAGRGLYSDSVPRAHGQVSPIHTSGTTGRPIRALRTELDGVFWSAFTLRDHLWHGRDLSGKLAVVRRHGKDEDPYPDGSTSRQWGTSSLVFRTGPAVSLNINCTVAEQVDWLQRQDPDYLLTHPTNLYRLASYCIDNKVRLPKLRQAQTIAEVVRPEVREACRAAWDVDLADIYTGREVGYLALQCPESGDYHIQSEGALVEVVDGDGRACGSGEVGRVLVTPLHGFAMPLIRYEIGDQAEVGAPCPCGRGLSVLKRILGRQQDMVALPNGEKRWTLLSTGNIENFLEIAPVRQYQFVQKDLKTIEIRLAVERDLTESERKGLRAWVVSTLDHPFTVEFSFVDEIPRTPAGKYRDFVSEIEPAP
ncbi:MAG: phenylacetate--CoA ligase family protein [Rhodospirillales bacterium]